MSIRSPLSWPSFDPGDLPDEVIYNPDGTITYIMGPEWDDHGQPML